jgi:hypothetical protein
MTINQTAAAIHSIKTRGHRLVANLNNGECCATCRHTKLNEKLCALSDKLMFRCMCNAEGWRQIGTVPILGNTKSTKTNLVQVSTPDFRTPSLAIQWQLKHSYTRCYIKNVLFYTVIVYTLKNGPLTVACAFRKTEHHTAWITRHSTSIRLFEMVLRIRHKWSALCM